MLQSFRPQDFIHLPPLGESGTLTLVDELAEVARSTRGVPPQVTASLARLLDAIEDTKKQIALRERAGSRADPRARAADRELDDAWGAIQSWLLGWTKLPDGAHPHIPDARSLYAAMFPKGLQFLTLDFKDEWAESQNRIDQILQYNLEVVFEALGGHAFFETVMRAHKAYGQALHITPGSATAPDPDASVRRALDATHMALREYVAQIAATVRRNERDSVSLAAVLLGPLSARSEACEPSDEAPTPGVRGREK
jgi:hypothetical protein